MVRVVVADPTSEARRALADALAPWDEFHIDGQTDNGFEAILMAEDMRPDFVVLELLMPLMTGYSAIPEIHKSSPRTQIVVYSSITLEDGELEKLGAQHYVSKLETTPELLAEWLHELGETADRRIA